MSVIIGSGVTDTDLPRLAWHMLTGTVTATTETTGYEATRAAEQETYDGWRPTAIPSSWTIDVTSSQSANYMAIAGHDLTGYSIRPRYWDGATFQPLAAEAAITSDTAILYLFPAQAATQFRLNLVSGPGLPTISHIRFGTATTVPQNASYIGEPIDESERITLRHNLSETGEFLGSIVEGSGLEFSVEIKHLSETFRQGDWRDFRYWADRGNAFFIAPKPASYPLEVAYARLNGAARMSRDIPKSSISGSVAINCIGLRRP